MLVALVVALVAALGVLDTGQLPGVVVLVLVVLQRGQGPGVLVALGLVVASQKPGRGAQLWAALSQATHLAL